MQPLTHRRRLLGLVAGTFIALTAVGSVTACGNDRRLGDDGKVGGVQVQENYPDTTITLSGDHGKFKLAKGMAKPQPIQANQNINRGFFDLVINVPAAADNTRFSLHGLPGEIYAKTDASGDRATGKGVYANIPPGTYELMAGDNRQDKATQVVNANPTGIFIQVKAANGK